MANYASDDKLIPGCLVQFDIHPDPTIYLFDQSICSTYNNRIPMKCPFIAIIIAINENKKLFLITNEGACGWTGAVPWTNEILR